MTPLSSGVSRPDGTARIAVVVSRYNESITRNLLDGAMAEWSRAAVAGGTGDGSGGDDGTKDGAGGRGEPVVVWVAGAFELVGVSAALARSGRYDGVVALGCVIKGETRHDRYIAAAVANGLADVAAGTGVAVAFGVLTTQNARQARERSAAVPRKEKKRGGKGESGKGKGSNKGVEAMRACLAAAEVIRAIRNGREAELREPAGQAVAAGGAKGGGGSKRGGGEGGEGKWDGGIPDKARAGSDRDA